MVTLCGTSQFTSTFFFIMTHFPDEEAEAQGKEQPIQSQPHSPSRSQAGGSGLAWGLAESWDHLSLLPKLWPLGPAGNVLVEASARVKAVRKCFIVCPQRCE